MDEYRQRLLDEIAAGALVLTVNKRLTRHLRDHFDQRMQQSGVGAWRTPQIMSLDLWLHSFLEACGLAPRLLEPAVAQRLWEMVIAADTGPTADAAMLRRLGMRAAEAYQLLEAYGVTPAGLPLTPDQEAFLRWRNRYLQRLVSEHWIDPTSCARVVTEILGRGEQPLPPRVILAGFDEIAPHIRLLLEGLRTRGVQVVVASPPILPQADVQRVAVGADRQGEIRLAARWVRGLLQAGASDIGIVVPDLPSYRNDIERIFREELDPASLLSLSPEEHGFSLSIGAPLQSFPPVRAALEVLALDRGIDLDRAGFMLRSPYLGGGLREMHGRSLCDARLRRRGVMELALSGLAREAVNGSSDRHLPVFAGIIKRLDVLLQDGGRRPPSAWSVQFLKFLDAAGWPGERALSSSEYQACRAMRELAFGALGAFDRITGPVSRGEALGLLQQLAADRQFQPEAPVGPVQVVGVLEASGLSFQHCWILGLTSEILPQPVRANPLLPIPLQVRYGMPHASAERELQFARQVLARLLASAPQVVLSHPLREGDTQLAPSPLITRFPLHEPNPLAESQAPASVWQRNARSESYLFGDAPPLTTGSKVRGGVGVLRDQAQCPFRAFARHRLVVQALDEPEPGIDLSTRGSLLHGSLEWFWREVRTSTRLKAMQADELREQVAAAVNAALAACRIGDEGQQISLLRQLETERLQQLLIDWLLNVEVERPPFEVVRLEECQEVQVGGVCLDGRIDRIDRLADGGLVLIDYKSGRLPKSSELVGEPLLEPQLPAYAITAETPPSGVVFASVRRGGMRCVGIGTGTALPHGTTDLSAEDWQRQLVTWRQQVESLAEAFAQGDVAAAPFDRVVACRNCDFVALCRSTEAAGIGDEEEGE